MLLVFSGRSLVRMPSASCFKSAGSLLYCPLAANLSTFERIQSHSSPCLKHTFSFENTSSRAEPSSFLGSSIQGLKALQLRRAVHTSSAIQCAMAEAGTKEALSKLKVDDAMEPSAPSVSLGSVKAQVTNLFGEALKKGFPNEKLVPQVAACNNPKFGDYQCNNAMSLFAKVKGKGEYKNPRSVGEAIQKNLAESPMVASTSIAGPGFVNVKLSTEWIEQRLLNVLKDGMATWAPILPYKRVVVDFSSPNIAKEMHVGHLRSTIIGDSIARMIEYTGVDVLRRNHVGDWGTQFGMLIQYLFDEAGGQDALNDIEHKIGDLQVFYKASKKRFDEDPDFKERSQQAVVKLQSGDPVHRKAWEKICDISRKEFEAVYQRLNVKLEERGESFYNPFIPDILKMLDDKGLTEISDGATCIFFPGQKDPLMVRKSDGGYGYASTDMTALWYRLNEEKADWVIYVTDVGQSNHFKNVFKAAQMAGWVPQESKDKDAPPPTPRVDHVGFGLVLGDDGKRFRTRSSEVVRLVDLLDEAKTRCKQQMVERGREDDFGAEETEHASAVVGYGAVKYADLQQNRMTNYTFSFDRMLELKGNTAVYLLYALARIFAIIRKSGKSIDELKQSERIQLLHEKEVQLGLHLLRFSEVVENAIDELSPNGVCEFLYDLSEKFNEFYTECRVVNSPEESSRLLLCAVTAEVMQQGFKLLGIQPLQRL